MDGLSGDFGSVGAVSGLVISSCILLVKLGKAGVKNPIKLASAVLRHSREPDSLGRIRPM